MSARTHSRIASRGGRSSRSLLGALLLCAASAGTAHGQQTAAPPEMGPRSLSHQAPVRPFEDRADALAPPRTVPLPPLEPAPAAEGMPGLATGLRVPLREIRVVGATAFSPGELRALVSHYEGQEIASEDLLAIRDAITRHYVERGYLSSGARIPDQSLEGGVLRIEVVEGRIGAIEIEGTRRLRDAWIRGRAALGALAPLRIERLQSRLRLLQQDRRIERLHATLTPGDRPGLSRLAIEVEEARPWDLELRLTNERSETIGGESFGLRATHHNLTGSGDVLDVQLGAADGLDEADLRYAVPLNRFDTTLELRFAQSASELVERPFQKLDIESRSRTISATLSHPLLLAADESFWVGLSAEYRRSETSLLGRDFSFGPGPHEGVAEISVLRLFQEWTFKRRGQVVAARSALSLGVRAFGARLDGRVGGPDPRFQSWLGQLQWVRRMSALGGATLLWRADLQWTNDPLLPLERFAVGGSRSVRGYRENTLVRDSGLATSIELRVPLLRSGLGEDLLQLAPFADLGRAWNVRDTASLRTIASVGLGLRYRVSRRMLAEVYWGHRLRTLARVSDGPQDFGWHFRLHVGL